jgi:hypothetical protein
MSRHTLAVGQEVLNSLQISLRKLGHKTVVDTAFEQPVTNIDGPHRDYAASLTRHDEAIQIRRLAKIQALKNEDVCHGSCRAQATREGGRRDIARYLQ